MGIYVCICFKHPPHIPKGTKGGSSCGNQIGLITQLSILTTEPTWPKVPSIQFARENFSQRCCWCHHTALQPPIRQKEVDWAQSLHDVQMGRIPNHYLTGNLHRTTRSVWSFPFPPFSHTHIHTAAEMIKNTPNKRPHPNVYSIRLASKRHLQSWWFLEPYVELFKVIHKQYQIVVGWSLQNKNIKQPSHFQVR